MEVSVTSTEGLERKMTVAVPPELIEKQVKERLKSLAGKVRLDGFRPGKIPLGVIERRYGAQVREEVSQDVMQQSFREAVVREKLRLVGQPKIESTRLEPGKGFEYTAVFEIYPEVKVTVPNAFKVEKPVVEVLPADVDNVLERMRKQQIEWKAVERAAEEGDRINLDFVGTVEGEPFDGGEAQAYEVVIGSKSLIGDFESQLVGACAGEQRGLNVTFPDNYPVEKLAGIEAHFSVTINSVSRPSLPEIDDKFAKRFGINDVESLRKQVRDNIEREVAQAVRAKVKDQVISVLLDSASVEVPNTLVENEIEGRMNNARSQLLSSGVTEQNIKLDRGLFVEAARRSVTLGLIVSHIIKEQDLKVSPEDLRHAVETLAVTYEKPEEVVKWYYGNRGRLGEVEALLLEDQTIDWALQSANITEKAMAVQELLHEGEGSQ